jgi:hypothetical protein
MSDDTIDDFWIQQKEWSTLADKLKSDISFWRKTVLLLSIAGAFLSTLSTQVPIGTEQKICVWLGAALLAIIPVVTPKKLSPEKTKGWTVARSVSEGIEFCLFDSGKPVCVNSQGTFRSIITLESGLQLTKS